jgi:glycosyltransferase involved in cell wall biosynthesis
MIQSLVLVGETPDFQPIGQTDKPEWEHTRMLAQPGTRNLCIDRLRTHRLRGLIRRLPFDPGQLLRIRNRVTDADAVIAQSEAAGYVVVAALFATFSRKRLNIIFHGQRWFLPRNRKLARLASRMPNVRFCPLSISLGRLLQEEYGVPSSKIRITGFGADAEFFHPRSSEETAYVVSAGTASRDYRTLLLASEGLGVPVKIAADSTWYREKLNTEGIEQPENVEIFSSGDYETLRDLYAGAHFVVVPLLDVRYACGYAVIAEAMAMGKAVIVTRNGAPSDLVEDGVTGIYVAPGDAPALRAAMLRLLNDPVLAREMGRAARAAVEREFNLEAYVGRLRAAVEN